MRRPALSRVLVLAAILVNLACAACDGGGDGSTGSSTTPEPTLSVGGDPVDTPTPKVESPEPTDTAVPTATASPTPSGNPGETTTPTP